jgi:DNA-3-methyladenine glycosylase
MSVVDAVAAAPVLTRAFFARPAPAVARELIGMVLCRRDEPLAARIVEVEAYTQDDPACHAYRGWTVRNAPLFGPAGHAYVYRSYGMHWCFNVSTGSEGVGQGCLIRAAEPLRGHDLMRSRRPVRRDADLLRGPAKLCQALDITGALSGTDLCADAPLRFHDDGTRPPVAEGPRVGVSLAADVPWRFFVATSPWVSAYRRSPRAPRP